MKTQVLFFFDTEDFTSEDCADAVLTIAKILEEEDVIGHFAGVGLFAEQLTNWGRDDVKTALWRQIIGTHTYGHSLHPDIAEMSDGADYDATYQKVMTAETKAVELIRTHLGTERILFATRPGDSLSYVGLYCYHEMGIRYFCDTVIHDEKNTLMEYCSMTQLPYSVGMEELFLTLIDALTKLSDNIDADCTKYVRDPPCRQDGAAIHFSAFSNRPRNSSDYHRKIIRDSA